MIVDKDLDKIYYGNNEISKLYYGTNLIWDFKENTGGYYGKMRFKTSSLSVQLDVEGDVINADDSISKNKKYYITYDAYDFDKYATYNDVNGIIEIDFDKYVNDYHCGKFSLKRMSFNYMNSSSVTEIYEVPKGITDISYMFRSCNSLTSLDLSSFDMSNVTNMSGMFMNISNSKMVLDLSTLNFNNVENNSIQAYDGYNSSSGIFSGLYVDTLNLTGWNLNKLNSLQCLFFNSLMKTLIINTDISTHTYFKKKNSLTYMFSGCSSLTTVAGNITGIKVNLDLSYSPLTNESAMVFINGLAEVEETQTIRFSSSTYNTLTEEQIAIATSKGWTVTG